MRGIVIATVLALAFLVAPVEAAVAAASSSAPATSSHNRIPLPDDKKEEPQRKKSESSTKLTRGVLCRSRVATVRRVHSPVWTDVLEEPAVELDVPKRTEHLIRLLRPPALQVFRN
ncbi:hypothetical protein UK23_04375 [Lentzea aerocolonigenes]|uniref:Uncharacterized protein n=1 Tax=Lentzea aerocolonigenes TaxID=68170 RepID=A0A0F0HEV0_LENAE|nr:hypothetical protein [Lentzea aerocolonigenes]KJK52173.1 hypothetical protein UK23_04375 [Lentzea aerocolonigenes]